jgi:hypothetical protein
MNRANLTAFLGTISCQLAGGVDEIPFIVGSSHPNSLKKIIHTLQYMVNVSYIAERQ